MDYVSQVDLLYPKQRDAIFDRRRYSLIEASTKAGKTSGCILWIWEQAFCHGAPGRNYWWIAPVSDQARIAFRRMLQYAPRTEFNANLSDRCIKTSMGTTIWFKSADKPDCYDDQTEILTRRGWKLFSELLPNDEVMTRAPNAVAQWQKPTRIIRKFHDGEMVKIENRRLDLLVTPNHRLLVERRCGKVRRGKWDRCARRTGKVVNLVEEWITADRIKPSDRIPARVTWRGADVREITDDHCALLGFYLAEGSALGNASSDEKARALVARCGYRVFFAQTAGIKGGNKGNVREAFEEVLARSGYQVRPRHDGLTIWNKALWTQLIGLGNKYTKFIPDAVKNLPASKLKILLHWLVMGDGWTSLGDDGQSKIAYSTVSKRLADDVQEIAIKCGLSATIRQRPPIRYGRVGAGLSRPLYIINMHRATHRHLSSSIKGRYYAKTHYRGMVYCVSVPNTCVLVRRNGKPCWSGNSLYGEDVYAAVIDEASRVKEDAWFAIRSTLTYTRGPVRIIGNVKGRKNWFYDMARRAEKGDPDMGYHRMVAYDAIEAGVLDTAEVEDAKRTLPEHAFRELYLAEPSDDTGNPFGGDEAIDRNLGELSTNTPFWWGWDLAKSVDWTVGVALDARGHVCRFDRFRQPWGETIARIRRNTGYCNALVDSTGVGDPIVEELQRRNKNYEGYHFTPSSKQKLMEGLAAAIQSGSLTYPAGPIPIELKTFEYEYTAHGVRYSAPENANDDCVMALALAVMHKAHSPPLVDFNEDALARVRRAPDIRRRYA